MYNVNQNITETGRKYLILVNTAELNDYNVTNPSAMSIG